MALDFPSNPIDGQVYGSYVWNAAINGWQGRPLSSSVAVTSPVKPVSANNGDIWYNTSNGVSYIYFQDGTSSQWIEMLSSNSSPDIESMPNSFLLMGA